MKAALAARSLSDSAQPLPTSAADLTHPARPEGSDDFVRPETGTGGEGHRPSRGLRSG